MASNLESLSLGAKLNDEALVKDILDVWSIVLPRMKDVNEERRFEVRLEQFKL